ncbi:MAG: NTP transferase domain-containing protein, partial [Actinomycetia bacterium]|nr:NTP transferase domain-containing protein [Actinomycetes bacterium]
MEVLILAAGRGKRLKPLTDYIPKPLLPIEGKPVLQHIFEVLIECNLNKTGIVLGYLGKIIEKYISDNPVKNLELSYAYQEELLGSANAVKEGKSVISEDFLLIAADTVFHIRDV